MSHVSLENLEQRLSQLEQRVAELSPKPRHEPGRDDWKRTIGMFRNDPIAQEVIRETLRIREDERERAEQGDVE
ncbi:MAG: hypothetical protein ACKV2Q_27695 [Planctomycetaceae bacterium]